MDIETGKIIEVDTLGSLKERILKIKEEHMTARQKESMQVSLQDTRSILGKQLYSARVEYGYNKRKKISRSRRKNHGK